MLPVVLGERHIVDRGRDLERRRAESAEVRIGVESDGQQGGLQHLLEPFLANANRGRVLLGADQQRLAGAIVRALARGGA